MKYRVLLEQDEDGSLLQKFHLCQAAPLRGGADSRLSKMRGKQSLYFLKA